MRVLPIGLLAISMSAAGPAIAQNMANMPGMGQAASPAKTGKGIGTIKAIDAKAGMLTIQHGTIPGVGWPPMTMAFKANPPSLLRSLRVGQKIGFDVKLQGMAAEVTAVRPE